MVWGLGYKHGSCHRRETHTQARFLVADMVRYPRFLDCVWNVYGICLDCVCTVSGISPGLCLGCGWNVFEMSLDEWVWRVSVESVQNRQVTSGNMSGNIQR